MAFGSCLLGAEGCSTLNTTDVQCLSQAECLAKGPAFANTTCSPVTKTCVAEDAGVGTCTSNNDCIAANNNLPAICRHSDHTCVPLATPECPDVIDVNKDVHNDDTIVLGYFGCMNDLATCVAFENIVKMVQNDVFQVNKGVPYAGTTHPVIWVACNEFNVGPDGLLNGAKHLANDIQVPIMSTPYDDGHALPVVQEVGNPAGVLQISPAQIDPSFAQLPGNPVAPTPFFWRISGDQDTENLMLVAALSDGGSLQKRLVDQGIKNATDPVKMLIVQEQSPSATIALQGILAGLTLNGKTGNALVADTAHFRTVSEGDPVVNPVEDPDPVAAGAVAVAAAVGGATPFLPHIIVYAADNPYAVPYVVQPIEAQWPTGANVQPPPLHVSNTPTWTNTIPPDTSLATRLFVADIALPTTTPTLLARQAGFFTRYNQFNQTTGPAALTAANVNVIDYETYDAINMDYFILAAMGNQPLTGANAAQATLKLASNGQPEQDDPTNLVNAFGLLSQGQAVTIDGLSGLLPFSAKTGAPPVDPGLYCICIDPVFGPTEVPTGYSFSATTNTPIGSIDNSVACPLTPAASPCPPGY